MEENLLKNLATHYELTGAQIVSAVMHASLLAIDQNEKYLSKENILSGIKEEFEKEERQFNAFPN